MSEQKSNRRARHAVKEHLPRWMLDLAAQADEILAASPYVTEGRLFKKCDPKRARLYTAFNALSFISGASSLRVLKGLLSKGVAIYNVDFLHAKVVMINGEHFSLGSQNLTVRGRRTNIEASFVAGANTPTKEVKEFFARIHTSARAISAQEIVEMEKLIEPWTKKFKEIEQAADGIDQFLEAKRRMRETLKKRMRAALEKKRREEQEQATREAEEQAKLVLAEQAKREAERLASQERSEKMKRAVLRLNKFFDETPVKPEAGLIASVKKVINNSTGSGGWFSTSTESLFPIERTRNFEQLLRAVGVTPRRFSRYLVVNVDDGKLGFVRFAKTRWTYFENGLAPHELLPISGVTWKVEIDFDWSSEGSRLRNGVAYLRSPDEGSPRIATVGIAFSITGLELNDIMVEPAANFGKWAFVLKDRVLNESKAQDALKTYLSKILTRPFKYKENLRGREASSFFKMLHPSQFLVQAHKFNDTAIFSVRQHPPRGPRMLPVNLGDLFS